MTAAAVVAFDPVRDKTYRASALGRDIADWLAWLELGGTSHRTLDQYERDLARGALMFPQTPVGEWTDSELLHVAKSFRPAERRVRMAAWRSFFRWARQTKRITANPTEELPRFKRPHQKVADVFSEAEVEALLALTVEDAAPLAVLLEAGLRKAEARMLQFGRCLPESGRVSVIDGKGGRDRVVPMSERLRSLLAHLSITSGLRPSDHIFYRTQANEVTSRKHRDKPIGEGTFARWWRRSLDTAGVRYRRPHTARHTAATGWRRAGLTIDEIQILLGHASIATTKDVYVHTTVEDVERRMRELNLA